MKKQKTTLQNKIINRMTAWALALALTTSLLAGMGCIRPQTAQAAVTLHNPTYDAATDTATWDCVYFGNYWQSDTNGDGTADKNDAKKPIKWRVLSVDGDDVFLLADKNLDCKRYNTTNTSVTWETCTLRSWLNGYGSGDNAYGTDYTSDNFIDSAFSATEQGAIKNTNAVNEDNPYYGIEGGNNTTDKVYLLSIAEASKPAYGFKSTYESSSDTRVALNTEYAKKQGAYTNTSRGSGWWWLRSPGYGSDYAAGVDYSGYGYDNGGSVDLASLAVRPALHLTLSSSTPLTYAGTVSSGGGSTGGGDRPVDTEGADRSAYTSAHLSFINSAVYKERMENKWASVISTGLDTTTGKVGETMYNVIDSACDLISFKASALFENPYDVVITDLICAQAELEEKDFTMKFSNAVNSNIQSLQKICKYADENFEVKAGEYETSLKKLFASPKSVKESNPVFYQMCEELFGDLFEQGKLDSFLGAYGKANDWLDAYNKYVNVVEWLVDCLRFNSLVSAYISTSDEFKAALLQAEHYMALNASGDSFLSRVQYGNLYEQAYNKYAGFMTDAQITDELWQAFYVERLFEEYFKNGMGRIADVFASAIQKNVISYLSEGLGLTGAAAAKIFAAVTAAKVGWGISEAITKNGTNIECRELARASYYLEDAMAWMVEDAAGTLQKEPSYEVARQFDAAYTILQNLECYALNNYVTYLNAQQTAFVQSMLHGFKKDFNEAEISLANIEKLKWQQAVCHEVGNGGLAYSTISVAKICCPVDVFVYDSAGTLVFSVEDNVVTKTSRGISGSVANDIKVLAIPDAADYRVDIRATKSGTMTYLLDTYNAADGTLLSSDIYTNVDIAEGDGYTASFDGAPGLSKNGTASEGGSSIEPTKHTQAAGEKTKITSVQAQTDALAMEAGETVKVSAKVLPEDAYCPVLSWTSSDNNVATVDESGTVTAKKAGSAVLQCMAIDGSEISDTINVTVSAAPCPHGHTAQKDKKEATCTEDGYSGDTYCTECETILEKGTVIPAAGHTWDAGVVTKEPSTTQDGVRTFTCSVCGETKTEAVPAVSGNTPAPGEPTITPGKPTEQPTHAPGPSAPPAATETPDGQSTAAPTHSPVPTAPGTYGIGNRHIKKGDFVIDRASKATYLVTQTAPHTGTVEYYTTEKTRRKAVVPAEITINGRTYKVTSIAPKAFAKCKKLKKATIGKYVTRIGKNAFRGCKALRLVTVKSKALKKVGKNAFKGTGKKLKVKVPKSLSKAKKKKYKKLFKGKGNKKLRLK